MNADEATESAKAIPYPLGMPKEDRPAADREYRKAVSEVEAKFKDWLAREYAPWLAKETQDMIWRKAWADGHAHGYWEVENHYMDLADFAEDVVNQNKE